MALCFIYFKKSGPKPARRLAKSDFEWSIRSRTAHTEQALALRERLTLRGRVHCVLFSIFLN
jgi:hypothetical protein